MNGSHSGFQLFFVLCRLVLPSIAQVRSVFLFSSSLPIVRQMILFRYFYLMLLECLLWPFRFWWYPHTFWASFNVLMRYALWQASLVSLVEYFNNRLEPIIIEMEFRFTAEGAAWHASGSADLHCWSVQLGAWPREDESSYMPATHRAHGWWYSGAGSRIMAILEILYAHLSFFLFIKIYEC